MFKQVLVPTDGSPTSEAAVKYAIALAKAFDGSVMAITLFDPYPVVGTGPDYAYMQAQYQDTARNEADGILRAAQAVIEAAGLKAHVRVIESQKTWRGIVDAANELKADVIVMGSHGRSGIDRLVMGSVTQRVLQHTKLPVLVVRD